jgi:hypothetical protein
MEDFEEIAVSSADANAEGFEAAFNGQCETDNRYPIGSDAHMSWNDGYESFFAVQEDSRKCNARPKRPDSILEKLERMTVAEVAELLNWPLASWPGNCFGVASQLVEALNWSDATAVYGTFNGDVSPDCDLFYGKPVIHHGWVLTSQGCIVDPTRWVFDAAEPAVTILKPWEASAEELEVYDEGGETLARLRQEVIPQFVEGERTFELSGPGVSKELVFIISSRLAPRGTMPVTLERVSLTQVRWLANMPYSDWGAAAGPVYTWLASVSCKALVPFDFWKRAVREGQLSPG